MWFTECCDKHRAYEQLHRLLYVTQPGNTGLLLTQHYVMIKIQPQNIMRQTSLNYTEALFVIAYVKKCLNVIYGED